MSVGKKPPEGRFKRLGKMAALTARLTGDLLAKTAGKDAGADARAAERITETLGELKGAAMKFGQMLSMDPTALSEDGRKLLSKLQSQAPHVPWDEMEDVLIDELGGAPTERFAEFDPSPIASASLGQVYRAKTRDGRNVAVKVQYPGIQSAIRGDLENLGSMVKALGLAGRAFDVTQYYDEIRHEMSRELDYRLEAEQAALFRERVRPWPELDVPEIVPELSSGRVLTSTLVSGMSLAAFAESDADNEARLRVSRQLVLAIFGPLLANGMVHADPHPGNFLVTPDGRLAILDFGAVKHLSPVFVQHVREALKALLAEGRDLDLLPMLQQGGFAFEGEDPEDANEALNGARNILRRPVAGDYYDYGASTIAEDLREYGRKKVKVFMGIRPPAEAVMFFRALAGCSFNLRALRGKGNFRKVVEELVHVGQA
ncbi:MAG: ABC1 kinase family protein [Myxococcales bacterium]